MLRKFVATLTALVTIGGVTLFIEPAAKAQDTAPAINPIAALSLCDPGPPPPSLNNYWGSYDGSPLFDACFDCNLDAIMLGAIGWKTWCWETATPARRAELWYAP